MLPIARREAPRGRGIAGEGGDTEREGARAVLLNTRLNPMNTFPTPSPG